MPTYFRLWLVAFRKVVIISAAAQDCRTLIPGTSHLRVGCRGHSRASSSSFYEGAGASGVDRPSCCIPLNKRQHCRSGLLAPDASDAWSVHS